MTWPSMKSKSHVLVLHSHHPLLKDQPPHLFHRLHHHFLRSLLATAWSLASTRTLRMILRSFCWQRSAQASQSPRQTTAGAQM